MMNPLSRPGVLLHLEGLGLLVMSVALYWGIDGSWVLFAALFLAPDLALLGYLGTPRVAAPLYNLAHTALFPLGLGVYAVVGAERAPGLIALIWLAHIGFDRLLGYGLKYPTGFKDTHLGRV